MRAVSIQLTVSDDLWRTRLKNIDLNQLFDGAKEIITHKEAIERGLKLYFTGKPCKHGHVADRLSNGTCVTCRNIYKREYSSRPENIKKQRAKSNIHYKNNKILVSMRSIEWQKSNPDKYMDIRLRYHKSNKNKHNRVERESRRRARKQNTINTPCAETAIQKYRKNGGLCFYCSKDVAPKDVHCDHVIPISKRGPHAGINLVLSCSTCNISKGANTPSTWRKLPEKHRRRALNREQKVLEWLAIKSETPIASRVKNAITNKSALSDAQRSKT